jgi:hypothetical protein
MKDASTYVTSGRPHRQGSHPNDPNVYSSWPGGGPTQTLESRESNNGWPILIALQRMWHTLSGRHLHMALAMGCGSPRHATLREVSRRAARLSFRLAAWIARGVADGCSCRIASTQAKTSLATT